MAIRFNYTRYSGDSGKTFISYILGFGGSFLFFLGAAFIIKGVFAAGIALLVIAALIILLQSTIDKNCTDQIKESVKSENTCPECQESYKMIELARYPSDELEQLKIDTLKFISGENLQHFPAIRDCDGKYVSAILSYCPRCGKANIQFHEFIKIFDDRADYLRKLNSFYPVNNLESLIPVLKSSYITKTDSNESEDTHMQNSQSIQTNQKHCSKCGELINPETKKCTGCGKQYLRPQSIVILLLSIFSVCSSLIALFYYGQCNAYHITDSKYEEYYGEYYNPITGERITSAQSYLDAIISQEYLEENEY